MEEFRSNKVNVYILVSNKIVYGNNEEDYGDDHMYLWRCNLNYKSNTIL